MGPKKAVDRETSAWVKPGLDEGGIITGSGCKRDRHPRGQMRNVSTCHARSENNGISASSNIYKFLFMKQ
jgi:hypothetical protein